MHAWQLWVSNVSRGNQPIYDYSNDLRSIFSRPIGRHVKRTEIEIEVLYKWVLQNYKLDPSGIANFLFKCKSREAVINTFNSMRMETIASGDVICFQVFPLPFR